MSGPEPGGEARRALRWVGLACAAALALLGAQRLGWIEPPRPRPLWDRLELTPEEDERYWMADLEPSAAVDGAAARWRTVFEDGFDRGELGPAWQVDSGSWTIEDGRLRVDAGGGEAVLALTLAGIPDDARITLWARLDRGSRLGFEGSLTVATRLPPERPISPWLGYELAFAGGGCGGARLIRGRVELARGDARLRRGEWHQLRIQSLGSRLAAEIDGRPLYSGVHLRQPRPGGVAWLGLVARRARVAIDDLRVEGRVEPDPRPRAAERAAAIESAPDPPPASRPVQTPPVAAARAVLLDVWEAEAEPALDPPFAPRWRQVLADAFDRDEPGDGWRIAAGSWEVRDGRLAATSTGDESMVVWTAADFSGDFRLAYSARTVEPSPAGTPCDMSFFCALPRDRPVDPLGGYLFRFGSFLNTVTGLSFGRHDLVVAAPARIQPGAWHRIEVQRLGRRFSMAVDGEAQFSGAHPAASSDTAAGRGGFYVWKSVVELDDVVYWLPEESSKARSAQTGR